MTCIENTQERQDRPKEDIVSFISIFFYFLLDWIKLRSEKDRGDGDGSSYDSYDDVLPS